MTKDLRFDLAGALIALAIIRLESTRQIGGYSLEGTPCRGMYFETENTHFQVAIDVFFFISFLGAKLVGRTGSRELYVIYQAFVWFLFSLFSEPIFLNLHQMNQSLNTSLESTVELIQMLAFGW